VINFWDWSENRARHYPVPFERVENLVKPQRSKVKRKIYREKWWRFAEPVPGCYHAIGRGHHFEKHPAGWRRDVATVDAVWVNARVTKYFSPQLVRNDVVFHEKVVVFSASATPSLIPTLQSCIGEIWVRARSSTLGFGLNVAPSDCIETLPFPQIDLTDQSRLVELSMRFSNQRSLNMEQQGLGFTALNNRFHDAQETAEWVKDLRQFQRDLDYCAAEVFGLSDVDLGHAFHKVEYLPENDNVRFTISNQARREILMCLADLNHEQYEEEVRKGLHEKSPNRKRPTPTTKAPVQQPRMPWVENQDGVQPAEEQPTYEAETVPELKAAAAKPPAYGDAAAAVLRWLEVNPGWHAKTEIIEGSGIDSRSWTKTINSLLGNRLIDRTGNRSATRYREISAGTAINPADREKMDGKVKARAQPKPRPAGKKAVDDRILVWLEENPQWHPVVRIANGVKAGHHDVIRALNGLVSANRVKFRTGNLGRGEYRKV
jgi:hypothetical protein